MHLDWMELTDDAQLAISAAALTQAADSIAHQAEVLAGEMERGALADLGGAEALRLFAAVLRVTGREGPPVAGHA